MRKIKNNHVGASKFHLEKFARRNPRNPKNKKEIVSQFWFKENIYKDSENILKVGVSNAAWSDDTDFDMSAAVEKPASKVMRLLESNFEMGNFSYLGQETRDVIKYVCQVWTRHADFLEPEKMSFVSHFGQEWMNDAFPFEDGGKKYSNIEDVIVRSNAFWQHFKDCKIAKAGAVYGPSGFKLPEKAGIFRNENDLFIPISKKWALLLSFSEAFFAPEPDFFEYLEADKNFMSFIEKDYGRDNNYIIF